MSPQAGPLVVGSSPTRPTKINVVFELFDDASLALRGVEGATEIARHN